MPVWIHSENRFLNRVLIASKMNVDGFTFDMSYYQRGQWRRLMRLTRASVLGHSKKQMFGR